MYERYYSYRESEEDDMAAHIAKVESLAIALENVGEKQSDISIMSRLLHSLPSAYASLITAWESVQPSLQTRNELISRLLNHEQRGEHSSGLEAAALVVGVRERSRKVPYDEWLKNAECHNCGQKGHLRYKCKKKVDQGPSKEVTSPSAHVLFTVGATSHKKDAWLIDSGASHHMCNEITSFKNFKKLDQRLTATIGDGSQVEVLGKGDIDVKCKVDNEVVTATLRDVAYLPQIAFNLFSTGVADAAGIGTKTDRGKYFFLKGEKVVAMGHKQAENLWLMDVEVIHSASAFSVRSNYTLRYWHELLGHASEDRIRQLAKEGLIQLSTEQQRLECAACPAGKGKRVEHPAKTGERAEGAGDRVYCDLAHINKDSLGYCYHFLCKDEATEYCFIYLAKNKTEVPLILTKLFIDFEVGCDRPIRTILSDNGSEIRNVACDIIMAKHGIQHVTTGTYAPQQNGIIEREVQTINNMARTMMINAELDGLPKSEALRTACYLRNRLPTKNSAKTPFERFTGRVPTLNHLHKFGAQVQIIRNGEYQIRAENCQWLVCRLYISPEYLPSLLDGQRKVG